MRVDLDPWEEARETFVTGRYLEAHQILEELWKDATGTDREFYQGLVLLAAALFHRDRGNIRGSQVCFARARSSWQGLPPERLGVNLAEWMGAVEAVLGEPWQKPQLSNAIRQSPVEA